MMAPLRTSSSPSASPPSRRTSTCGKGWPSASGGRGRPFGWGPKTAGPVSVVPQLLATSACGKMVRTSANNASVTGADPIATLLTQLRSRPGKRSCSRADRASMVGTAVRTLHWWVDAACKKTRASNDVIITKVPP